MNCRLVRRLEELHDLAVCQALSARTHLIIVSADGCQSLTGPRVVQIVTDAHSGVSHRVFVHTLALAFVVGDQRTGVAGRKVSRQKAFNFSLIAIELRLNTDAQHTQEQRKAAPHF